MNFDSKYDSGNGTKKDPMGKKVEFYLFYTGQEVIIPFLIEDLFGLTNKPFNVSSSKLVKGRNRYSTPWVGPPTDSTKTERRRNTVISFPEGLPRGPEVSLEYDHSYFLIDEDFHVVKDQKEIFFFLENGSLKTFNESYKVLFWVLSVIVLELDSVTNW